MSEKPLFIANTPIQPCDKICRGGFVDWRQDRYYKISNCDTMPAFFMTVVSSDDHWLFIGSKGGITAGRRNAQSALFPYYTHDKILANAENTGSKTIVKLHQQERTLVWEPFSDRYAGLYRLGRNLYKNTIGNKVLFEEINHDLGLIFRYEWSFSRRFGLVRQAGLENIAGDTAKIELLDGLQNILPAGVNSDLQAGRSNLVDAYKQSELDSTTGLAIFSLSSRIIDKAEPSEALSATTLWSAGLAVRNYLLSAEQLMPYRLGASLTTEKSCRARKGGYFLASELELKAGQQKDWWLVAEVNQSSAQAINLQEQLRKPAGILEDLQADISHGSELLRRKVALADGLQMSNDPLSNSRHFSNVLFNIMRGGIFEQQYQLATADLLKYLKAVNRPLYQQKSEFIAQLGDRVSYQDLLAELSQQKHPDLLRLCREYLPLSFSRRHGDPSRPWNTFNIELTEGDGQASAYYEGNWRDIFQNWEALAYSFPAYVEGMISKFVNASTADGYNPYRIKLEGIDWETLDPQDPWSYIGYWGDHQIIYLLKLLEHSEKHFPGKLASLLQEEDFVYANVPYRIRSYPDIVANPSDTIEFDYEEVEKIESKLKQLGEDAKILRADQATPVRANLAEKLLVSMLSKMYNLVPGGGIWLNTQRPEWNDANNALVGNGLSVVTLAYLRRFVLFSQQLFAQIPGSQVILHQAVARLAEEISGIFAQVQSADYRDLEGKNLKELIDKLGQAGGQYREAAYAGFTAGKQQLALADIQLMLDRALKLIDHSLAQNRRQDGLYHAYNLLEITESEATISALYEMLEGQVAILSSGMLSPQDAVELLKSLKNSAMYRPDQYSYLLYPNRELPAFLLKNSIPDQYLKDMALIKDLKEHTNQQLIEWDNKGQAHFAAGMHNAGALEKELQRLRESGMPISPNDEKSLKQSYEKVFNHKAFTGRSGSFFAYEGLGSIYWHMVSKLLLAVAEQIEVAIASQESATTIGGLMDHYYEIRAGIGLNKSPDLYGAFPTDAYSHTPAHAGAQQPGMTGQVKEDILSRWAELGVSVRQGQIHFSNHMLRQEEYLEKPGKFEFIDCQGQARQLDLPAHSLVFTYCQLPIIYRLSSESGLTLFFSDGSSKRVGNYSLDQSLSQAIFARQAQLDRIELCWPKGS